MTTDLVMYDTIDPAALDGLTMDAAAGYIDGRYQTYPELPAHVPPGTKLLSITILGGQANVVDVESGDVTPEAGAAWIDAQIHTGHYRPVLYTSASNVQTMINLIWDNHRRARAAYRIWSAHYGIGRHVCAKKACGYPTADGTQWTSGPVQGRNLDESALQWDFFACPVDTA